MKGKLVLITGATDGVGKKIAHDFAAQDANLLLHGRNPEKGQKVIQEIRSATGSKKLEYYNADFASLDEVRKLGEKIKSDYNSLDVLINNAGIGFGEPGGKRKLSNDGHELRFQVNYLAGFLLTSQLIGLLGESPPARIVNVASIAQQAIDFDNLMLENGYTGHRAYSQSKLAQIMFTFELADRLGSPEITVNALHPATYIDTKMVHEAEVTPLNTVEKGAEAVEYLVASPELEDVTGKFFNGKREARADDQAYDEEVRRQLWEYSEELTGIQLET